MDKKQNETPLMRQYYDLKSKYPDAVLLFRVGDFYETFGEDAIKASKILGIVLTKRANGSASFIELAGFPHHSLDAYLPKLVRAGERVAICEQLEDPKLTKKIVKRGITEIVTPGVVYNDKILDRTKNNFLASICFENELIGLTLVDSSTGEMYLAEGNFLFIDKLLQSFKPAEIIYPKPSKKHLENSGLNRFYLYPIDDWAFQFDFAFEKLTTQLNTNSLKGFGVAHYRPAVCAAGAALHYIADIQQNTLSYIQTISRIDENQFVWLDKFTIRNLELFDSPHHDAKTLIDVIDKTISPMGSRCLKRWIALPLKDIAQIKSRQNAVGYLLKNIDNRQLIINKLKLIGDLERLVSRAVLGKTNPRELIQLKRSLLAIDDLQKTELLQETAFFKQFIQPLHPCKSLFELIDSHIDDDAPVLLQKGAVIKRGISADLDDLKNISENGKDYLLNMQQRESIATGIPSLKISYNNIFGYYIEVTNVHKTKVPETWIRKQTMVNAERYITEELKEYEEKILTAEEKIARIEAEIYKDVVNQVGTFTLQIQQNAAILAEIDCLISFALVAEENYYILPEVHDHLTIDIKEGRHPVIEKQLPQSEQYVSNDVYLDNETTQILMITGPNMSGKSALLRQTALIVLMAQIGSFVPAKSASIGIVDKIFTRVGASDNISSGESTFMVEMNETAGILNNLSNRSLILLDEIGRGTSTYDGVSIAWAIAEYLHENGKYCPKTLFATHYHELNEMANNLPRIKNFHVSVKEVNKKIIFLRKLKEGGSHHSFGIHVAKMAGVPNIVIERANQILKKLEKANTHELTKKVNQIDNSFQLSFFDLEDPVLLAIRDEIKGMDVNQLTPIEALNKLNDIKKLLGV
jgi:DNA mismatch repair protein MutS